MSMIVQLRVQAEVQADTIGWRLIALYQQLSDFAPVAMTFV
jgi:hypothetical protein